MKPPNQTNPINKIKNRIKSKIHPSFWKCTCGCTIPKKGAILSGGPQYKQDYHVHCPECGKIVAQYVNPKETQ